MGTCGSAPPDPKLAQMREEMILISKVKKEIISAVSELENEIKDIRLAMATNENAIPEAGIYLHKSMRDRREKTLLNNKGLTLLTKDMGSLRSTYLQLNSSVSEFQSLTSSSKRKIKNKSNEQLVAIGDPHGLLKQRNSSHKLEHLNAEIEIEIRPMRVVDEDWLASIHKVPQTLIIDPIVGLLNRSTFIDNDESDEENQNYGSQSSTDEYRNRERHDRILRRKLRQAALEASEAAWRDADGENERSPPRKSDFSTRETSSGDSGDESAAAPSNVEKQHWGAHRTANPTYLPPQPPPIDRTDGVKIQALEFTIPVTEYGLGMLLQETTDPRYGSPGYTLMRVEGFTDVLVNASQIAGIRVGDVVIQVNGYTADTPDVFIARVRACKQLVVLTVLREHHAQRVRPAPPVEEAPKPPKEIPKKVKIHRDLKSEYGKIFAGV